MLRVGRRDVQHDYANGKGTLGLHAVFSYCLIFDDTAALGNVPWGPVVDALGVDCVGCGL